MGLSAGSLAASSEGLTWGETVWIRLACLLVRSWVAAATEACTACSACISSCSRLQPASATSPGKTLLDNAQFAVPLLTARWKSLAMQCHSGQQPITCHLQHWAGGALVIAGAGSPAGVWASSMPSRVRGPLPSEPGGTLPASSGAEARCAIAASLGDCSRPAMLKGRPGLGNMSLEPLETKACLEAFLP